MNSDFSRIITLQRKERKISQKQVAMNLGISQALLSHYEKGIRECGLDFLIKIADYYNVSCDYLLGRTFEPDENTMDSECFSDVNYNNCDNNIADSSYITFCRKIINNSVNSIFSIAKKAGSKALIKSIYSYFALSVYKVLRILYGANPDNDQKLFSISNVIADNVADSLISKNEAAIKASANGIRFEDNDFVNDTDTLIITTAQLSSGSEIYSASLLNLIKCCEDHINDK